MPADNSVITFECIDGADDKLQFDLEVGQNIFFSCESGNGAKVLKELEGQNGKISVSNSNGSIYVDASDCTLPVKLNGREIKTGVVGSADVLKIGNSIWKAFHKAPVATSNAKSSYTRSISNFMGLEELSDFKLSNIFSGVFKKHTLAETEE